MELEANSFMGYRQPMLFSSNRLLLMVQIGKNMVGNDNGKVRSNRTSNRKLDEIKGLLMEIRDLLKGKDVEAVMAEQRGMTKERDD